MPFSSDPSYSDLTNTFFEGTAAANPKAKFGRSKQKRTDCPLVTLGLVLDGSGFPRKSRIFAGNVSEGDTLETMLTGLGVARGAIVVMDAGLASEENISWLKEHHYRYLVVSRKRRRDFDENAAITVKSRSIFFTSSGFDKIRVYAELGINTNLAVARNIDHKK